MRLLALGLLLTLLAGQTTAQITGVSSSRPRQRAVGTPFPLPPGQFPLGHGGPDVESLPTVGLQYTLGHKRAQGHASPYGGNRIYLRHVQGVSPSPPNPPTPVICELVIEKNTPPAAVNVTPLNCSTDLSGDIRTYISDDGQSAVRMSDVGWRIHFTSDAGVTWDLIDGGVLASSSAPSVFDPVTGFTYFGNAAVSFTDSWADITGAGSAGFTRQGVFEFFFYGASENSPADTDRYALIRWSLPPGFDPQNPPTPTIIDRIDAGSDCTVSSSFGCYTNVAIGDRYIVVVYGAGRKWQLSNPPIPPNFRSQPHYAIIDTQTASAPVLGWVGETIIAGGPTSELVVISEEIDITPMGDGIFAFLRRKGGSDAEPIFAVSAIPIINGDFPNTGNGIDPLLSLNTVELSAFGIPSTSLAPFRFDKPAGAAKSILGFAAPWGTGLVDVITLGPPPQGVGPGTLNSLRRVRFTPGQLVGPLQVERLEDISEAGYAAMGIDLDMTLHSGAGVQQPTLSYCGIAGACVAFFRQDLFDAATGTFVAGRFLTDQD